MARDEFLKTLPPRLLFLVMGATIALTLLASYLYLFKKPLARYQELRSSSVDLSRENDADNELTEQIAALQEEIVGLQNALQGGEEDMPVNKLAARFLERLDAISVRHGVRLTSVVPQAVKKIKGFSEVPFSIEVTGSYGDLYRWYDDVEQYVGAMVVKQFRIAPAVDYENLKMQLEMATYRTE